MFKTNVTSLFTAYDNQWRRQRQIINPTFSTEKFMNKYITSLMNKI